MAITLANSMARHFRCKVPVSLLFQYTTVREFAGFLNQNGPRTEPSRLLCIKKGNEQQIPLYFVHPIGGSIVCYSEMGRHLDSGKPFYGIQQIDAGPVPVRTIEEMAADYLNLIPEYQSRRGFELGGWSFGGVVAYEMANQAEKNGNPPARLVLLDPTDPDQLRAAHISETQLISIFLKDMVRQFDRQSMRSYTLGESAVSLESALQAAVDHGLLSPDISLPECRHSYEIFRRTKLAICPGL